MKSSPTKICVVTGSRSEYGLLRFVMQGIQNSDALQLMIVVTGMHLSPEYGNTIREIEEDGFTISRRVEMLLNSDTCVGITKSVGLGLIGFADVLSDLQPDILLLIGDRFESFAAASSALFAGIPIVHIHGGESTEGAVDEALRHNITKMSHLHFVAADKYRNRVIQLGEHPSRVYTVGGLGVDAISKLQLLDRSSLEKSLDFRLFPTNFLITYHPVTLGNNLSSDQIDELLTSLEDFKDTGLLFTMPNADTDNRVIFEKISRFCATNNNAKIIRSLGQIRYLSCVRHFDVVIGNSSSGLLEVPSFKKATINIGDRQKGVYRQKVLSIVNHHLTLLESQSFSLVQKIFRKNWPLSIIPTDLQVPVQGLSKFLNPFPLITTLKNPFMIYN